MAPFLKHEATSAWETITNGILKPSCEEAQVLWSDELKNELKQGYTVE